MSWLLKLPATLRLSAYYANEEAAWRAAEALSVLECATTLGLAVCGGEVWLPTVPGPTIPTPYIYTWKANEMESEEIWSHFVQCVNRVAVEYIQGFAWDPEDTAHKNCEPYFNLDFVCSQSER